MALPFEKEKLLLLKKDALFIAIIYRRKTIRSHRDAKLDDRCWLTDWLVWEFLDDTSPMPEKPVLAREWKERCVQFYKYRRKETTDDTLPGRPVMHSSRWDYDLVDMDKERLAEELSKIQDASRRHRDIGGPRIPEDDRQLYAVLPERIPADFRLPPESEFLGRDKQDAGCPNFWDSHASCHGCCDLHKWGPC